MVLQQPHVTNPPSPSGLSNSSFHFPFFFSTLFPLLFKYLPLFLYKIVRACYYWLSTISLHNFYRVASHHLIFTSSTKPHIYQSQTILDHTKAFWEISDHHHHHHLLSHIFLCELTLTFLLHKDMLSSSHQLHSHFVAVPETLWLLSNTNLVLFRLLSLLLPRSKG